MKNIEKYFDEIIMKSKNKQIDCVVKTIRTGKMGCSSCNQRMRKDCKEKSLIWLNEEYYELIKLTKLEHDLLTLCSEPEIAFNEYRLLSDMKKLGNYKSITNINMPIGDILKTCCIEI